MEKLEYDKSYQERLVVRKKENEMLHKNTLKSHWQGAIVILYICNYQKI